MWQLSNKNMPKSLALNASERGESKKARKLTLRFILDCRQNLQRIYRVVWEWPARLIWG